MELARKEFAVLEYLMRNKNIVVTREQIESSVWNFDYDGASNVIDVYIRYLRKNWIRTDSIFRRCGASDM